MAGDWIKMRTNLAEDPAVVRLASGLKLDRFAIVGRLHKIWSWANEHSIDGLDVPVDAQFLDSLVATPGFAEQLRRVGWLSGRDGSLTIPNFLRHNGDSAKARALDTVRKRNVRKASGNCPDENRTETGPEKRREERDTTKRGISHVRPSIEEVAAYCRERGNHVDPQAWLDHYTANGWKVGRNPMKDWKAAVRQWERNDLGRSKPAAQGKPVTFAQQRQQNVLDLIAKLEAQEAQSRTPLLEAAR
jgi:hypothetical protein